MLLLLIQWLTAINYSSNLGFVLTFLLVAVGLVSMLHSYRNLSGLRVQLLPIKPVFAGETARLECKVINATPLPRYTLWLKAKEAEPVRFDVESDGHAVPTLGIRSHKRGWLQPGTITLYTEFPLGILYAWAPMQFDKKILVYPTPSPDVLPFPISSGMGHVNSTLQGTEEFSGLSRYQPGDALRRIHWKSVAKGFATQVKRYSSETSDERWFCLDNTPGNTLEVRLSRLCRWVVDAEAAGLRYGLDLSEVRIPIGLGHEHNKRCLEALALFHL